jgi:hypothetical protein
MGVPINIASRKGELQFLARDVEESLCVVEGSSSSRLGDITLT